MAEPLTSDSVISAVAKKLAAAVPEVKKRYKESQQQNIGGSTEVRDAYFFITQLSTPQTAELGRRRARTYSMIVRYEPASNATAVREKCRDMGTRLLSILEFVELAGHPLRGTDMSFEVVDEVLQFYVSYHVKFETRPEPIYFSKANMVEGVKE